MERYVKNTFCINRRLTPGHYGLADVFTDIHSYEILRTIFEGTGVLDQVLAQTRVILTDRICEMFVDNHDGSITIGLSHLRTATEEILYLDIIHELCHVQQFRDGRDLYDPSRAYVDRDTEIEAYLVTVREARRIGLDDEAIAEYLRVSWVTPREHERLARRLNVIVTAKENDAL